MSHWLTKVIELIQADTADLRQLARLAGGDPETFYVGTNLDGADIRGQDLRGMKFTGLENADVKQDENTLVDSASPVESIAESAQLIAIYGRQEDRLAILMDRLLSSPGEALNLLTTYRPRAKLEQMIVAELTASLSRRPHTTEGWQSILPDFLVRENEKQAVIGAIANAIDFALRNTFPTHRGTQLLSFAQHLSKYELVRTILKRRLAETRSVYVEQHRANVQELIQRAEI